MKKILFVINTLGHAGAETAMIEMLEKLQNKDYDIFLYVIMEQGELIKRLPKNVRLLNSNFSSQSVLSKEGRRKMIKTVAVHFFRNGSCLKKLYDCIKILFSMIKNRKIHLDKLLWRIAAEGAERFEDKFDLAIASIEGASAYYVADYVKADKKKVFIHIDYESSGYTRTMDKDCWNSFDNIFAVSSEVREHFAAFYPEYDKKVSIFYNMLNQNRILQRAKEPGGFSDGFDGVRLLTVGRLNYQKAYDIAIEAMKILKDSGRHIRWYVLGEGNQRKNLEKKIAALELEKDFILLGYTENPYPYYVQTDIYVHATRFEGKSIALQEAQILGCTVIASDCNGNREQIVNGRDGILCKLTPQAIADSIILLLNHKELRNRLALEAQAKMFSEDYNDKMLLKLMA